MKLNKKLIYNILIFNLVIGFILRLININKNLYIDEALALFWTNQPIMLIDDFIQYGTHPPLYKYFLHFLQLISTNVVFLRLSSVAFGILTIYVVYLIGKKLFNERVGLLASFFIAINSLSIQMSQQLRMYILATLFLCLTYYFYLQKRFTLYAIFGALSVWTEYFSLPSLGILALYTLYKEKFSKKIWITNILMAALILPVTFFLLDSIGVYTITSHSSPFWVYFILPHMFSVFLLGYINPYFINRFPIFSPAIIGLMISLSFFLYIFYRYIKQKNRNFELIFLMCVPIFAIYLMNPIISLQMESKRFMFSLCLLAIILAKGIDSFGKTGFTVSIILLSLINLVPIYSFSNYDYTDWKGVTNYIEKNEKEGDSILLTQNAIEPPIIYYYNGNLKLNAFPHTIDYFNKNWHHTRSIDKNNIDSIKDIVEGYDRLWLIENRIEGQLYPKDIVLNYLSKDYNLIKILSFSKGSLKLYLFEAK